MIVFNLLTSFGPAFTAGNIHAGLDLSGEVSASIELDLKVLFIVEGTTWRTSCIVGSRRK